MFPPLDMVTAQGYDAQFGTMVIGHYALSKLLIPMLEATAATLPANEPARIIEVTSDGHLYTSGKGPNLVNYNTIRPGDARTRAGSSQMYFQSKTANILIAKARARMLEGKDMISVSVHPGHIASNLQRHVSPIEVALVSVAMYFPGHGRLTPYQVKILLSPTPYGAITSTFVATAADTTGFNGQVIVSSAVEL